MWGGVSYGVGGLRWLGLMVASLGCEIGGV